MCHPKVPPAVLLLACLTQTSIHFHGQIKTFSHILGAEISPNKCFTSKLSNWKVRKNHCPSDFNVCPEKALIKWERQL